MAADAGERPPPFSIATDPARLHFALDVFTLMRIRLFALVVLVSASTSSLSASFDSQSLRVLNYENKADNYIKAAISLQAMGRDAACKALLTASGSNYVISPATIVLCRMLFQQRGTNEFRPPFLGGCNYYIGRESDWPLAPIALIDGIPFLLTGGCGGSGPRGPESHESYLRYCMTNCDWNTYRFREVSPRQKTNALYKLLSFRREGQRIASTRLESQIE